MGGIVFAGVAPHGWPLIPDLSQDAAGALQTRAALQELGRRCAAARDGRRVAFIASCDWAHTHEGTHLGAHPAAVEVDTAVVQALRDNAPGRLIDLDERQVEEAAIDGLWQTLILAGVMRHTPMRGELLSYEVPPVYATGMIVATFSPASEMD